MRPISVLIALALAVPVLQAADDQKGIAFFEARIRPVLAAHCLSCHSAEAAKAGKWKASLALDNREGVLRGGESGPIINSGKPAQSLLLKTLSHTPGAPAMPPGRKLPAAVIADFEAWIGMGAPDPRTGEAAFAKKKGMSLEEGRRFWSFIPPVAAAIPEVKDSAWAFGPIDKFVQSAREAKGIRSAGDADAETMARRLSFDLTGLPPDPTWLAEFVTDRSARAYERLVDRLLASPGFGEKWGRHWLDAARYADSNGRDRNIFWFHAWRYREYVIEAFNNDLPYNRFLREQIAGDLLPASTAAEADRQRVATGFLAMGPKAFEESKPEVFRMDMIDEQIDLIGRSLLGLSIGCARCHDHKFDPLPTRDYYAMAGIFRSTQPQYGHGTRGIKATAFHHTKLQPVGPGAVELAKEGQEYLDKLQELTLKQNTARSDRYRVQRQLSDFKVRLEKPGADIINIRAEIDRLTGILKTWDATVKAAEEELRDWQQRVPKMPGWAMAAHDLPSPENCRIHVRGEVSNLGEVVPRGLPRVFPHVQRQIPGGSSGRLELADWVVDHRNPLTARVQVNRVWQRLFGQGLVSTPDDFGVNGARPSHPELLDHLAVRFMSDGWSVKRLIRELVLSRTYRQSSDPVPESLEVDPGNTWLWRMPVRRIDAESLRDAILSLSGRLEPGRPQPEILALVHPYRDGEFTSFKPQFGQELFDSPKRSVYLPVIRGVLPEVFQLFDFPSPERPASARDESILPAQALFFMNSPWVIAESRRAAARLLGESSLDDAGRIRLLYLRSFARGPNDAETARAMKFVSVQESSAVKGESPGGPRLERWTTLCQAFLASAEFRLLR